MLSPRRTAIGFVGGLAVAWATRAGYVPFLPKLLELPAPLYYLVIGSFMAALAGISFRSGGSVIKFRADEPPKPPPQTGQIAP